MTTGVNLEAISDGRFYELNDLVRADAGGCHGCSACCQGVGELVRLNPYDVFQLTENLGMTLEALLEQHLELRLQDRLSLPYLRMTGPQERCAFLDTSDRCSIHGFRPDICRLFPLGRVYEPGDFKYILQVGACVKPRLEKVKVKKWISIDRYEANRAFLLEWHQMTKALAFRLRFVREEEAQETVRRDLLDTFYRLPPGTEDFYREFSNRVPAAKDRWGIL